MNIIRLTLLFLILVLFGAGLMLSFEILAFSSIRNEDKRITNLLNELRILDVREQNVKFKLSSTPLMSDTLDEDIFITSNSSLTSSALIQERIRDSVSKFNGDALSFQANLKKISNGSYKITVLVRARFSELGLIRFIRSLESNNPLLIFESFEVYPIPTPNGEEILEFTGSIVGFHKDEI